ncbi:caldesmon-like [Pseudophryne corroboree]
MHPPTVQEETSSQQPLPEENSSQGHPQTLPEESFSQSYPAIGDHNLVERTEQIPDMETSGSVPEVLESKTPETTPGESSLNLILEALKNMDQCRAEESQRINNRLDNMEQNIDHIKTAVVQQNDAMISLARYYDQLVSAHMSVVGHCKSMEQKIEQISTQQNEQRDGESHQEQLCRQHNDSLEHISLQCQQIGTGLQSMLLWQQQCNLNTSMISTSLQLMTDEGRRLHSAQPQQAERSSEVTTPSNRTSIDQEMYAQEERGDLAYQRALSVLRLQRQRSEELEQSIIQQEMWNRAQQEMLEQAQTVMWNRAQEEHARAQEEHARAQEEHARAQEEHARAQDEHATAPEEHATAPEEPSGSQEEPSTTAN